MTLELPNLNFSADDLRLELACALYARGRLSAVAGAEMAAVDMFSFQKALYERDIPRQYSADDLKEDVESLGKLFPA